jgi:hypothetical protein
MSKKLVLLLLLVVVLLGLSSAYVVGGLQAYSRYQRSHIQLEKYCNGQAPVHICVRAPTAIFSAFYPFYVTTRYPLFIVEYNSTSTTTIPLLISVSINRFSDLFVQNEQATAKVQSIGIIPPMLPHALDTLTDERQTSLQVRVTDPNGQEHYYVNDIHLTLHSRWLMQWTKDNLIQIAAWVTPDDRSVTNLVNNAVHYLNDQNSPPPSLVGYQTTTRQQVIAQVDAIYDALRHYSMNYVQETVPYDGTDQSEGVTEKILLPAEVLKQHSGMCIELTALLASAVEHIGLDSEIVIIPGHAFLGVAVTPQASAAGQYEYWDVVDVNDKIAGDSANVRADQLYLQNKQAHTIVATIPIGEARSVGVGPMVSSMM